MGQVAKIRRATVADFYQCTHSGGALLGHGEHWEGERDEGEAAEEGIEGKGVPILSVIPPVGIYL